MSAFWSLCLVLLQSAAAVPPDSGIRPVPIERFDAATGTVILAPGATSAATGNGTLLLASRDCTRLARASPAGSRDAARRFSTPPGLMAGLTLEQLAAWFVPDDVASRTLPAWPPEAALHTRIETVGPAMRSAWIHARPDWPLRPGDAWLLRLGGQPALRLDLRFVEARTAYCLLTPLAAGAHAEPGQPIELWRGVGEATPRRSAVCFVDAHGPDGVVWIAAPPGLDATRAARIEFMRDDVVIADGVVENADDRFWYVPLTPTGVRIPPTVGDAAHIRAPDDLRAGRRPARVFEVQPEGALINAGEADGLRTGQTARLRRPGSHADATVSIVRVQKDYSVVRISDPGAGGPPAVGDELWFAPPVPPPRVLGAVRDVVQESLIRVELADNADPPLLTPLPLRAGSRTAAVAILVTRAGQRAAGLVLDESAAFPPHEGLLLVDVRRDAAP